MQNISIGHKCYLEKSFGEKTLVKVLEVSDTKVTVRYIIDSKIRTFSIKTFKDRYLGTSAVYKDEFDYMAEQNKYIKSAKALRDYYRNTPVKTEGGLISKILDGA